MDKMEIINLHKICNKTDTKTAAKTGAETALKDPRSGYHLFLREHLDEMTGEDQKTYRSIVSRRWKKIKYDPARLSAHNDRTRQMKNEPTKLGNDSSVHEKTVAERSAIKQSQKAPKTPEFVDTGSNDSDNENEEKPKKGSGNGKKVKKTSQPKSSPKPPKFIDSSNEEQRPKKHQAMEK